MAKQQTDDNIAIEDRTDACAQNTSCVPPYLRNGDLCNKTVLVLGQNAHFASRLVNRSSPADVVTGVLEKHFSTMHDDLANLGLEDEIKLSALTDNELPFEDQRFDIVISVDDIGRWRNRQYYLMEVWRVLATGGHAFVSGIKGANYRDYFGMLMSSGIKVFSANADDSDVWIEIKRSEGDRVARQENAARVDIERKLFSWC